MKLVLIEQNTLSILRDNNENINIPMQEIQDKKAAIEEDIANKEAELASLKKELLLINGVLSYFS